MCREVRLVLFLDFCIFLCLFRIRSYLLKINRHFVRGSRIQWLLWASGRLLDLNPRLPLLNLHDLETSLCFHFPICRNVGLVIYCRVGRIIVIPDTNFNCYQEEEEYWRQYLELEFQMSFHICLYLTISKISSFCRQVNCSSEVVIKSTLVQLTRDWCQDYSSWPFDTVFDLTAEEKGGK